jgi:long-chain fatty acid transport protein
MGRRLYRPVGLAVVLGALAAPLAGQGTSVYNQSACTSGRGGVAVAAPCPDGSSVYYSPGVLAMTPSSIAAGFNAIYNEGSFTYDTTGVVVERDASVPIVPHAYVNYRFGPTQRWAAALGFWAPYGLTLEWPDDFEGRFVSWNTTLRGLYLQPTLAYQLIPGELAIGAGPQIVFSGIEINQAVDAPVADIQLAALGIPLGTDLATAVLSGSGVGVGGHFGAYYRASDRFALGIRYMMPVTVDLEGDADFEQVLHPEIILRVPDPSSGNTITVPFDVLVAPQFQSPDGLLADQDAAASIEFPPQIVAGFRVGVTPQLALGFDYQWTGWSTFDEIVADFSGSAPDLTLALEYNDTHTYRTGLTYTTVTGVDLQAGFIYNTAASPDQTVTPLLPESERQNYSAGVGKQFGAVRADLFYQYVNQADRRGRVRSALPGDEFIERDLETLNVGVYTLSAHLVGLSLSYVFGADR